MTKRMIWAGLLGGLAMFIWAFVAHMVLPLGEAGVKQIANDQPLLNALQGTIGSASGLYLFPSQQSASMGDYARRFAANPSGLLVYHPPGRQIAFAPMLITELLTEVVEASLAVFLLAQTRLTGFGSRVGFVTLIGVIAAITTNVSYWNWYAFPTGYEAAYMTTQIVGFVCAGIVAAVVL